MTLELRDALSSGWWSTNAKFLAKSSSVDIISYLPNYIWYFLIYSTKYKGTTFIFVCVCVCGISFDAN